MSELRNTTLGELAEMIRSELRPDYHITPGGLKWSLSTNALRELVTRVKLGWPYIPDGTDSPSHSPVDRYRCKNEECNASYSVWEFCPDDYDLDESAVCCPACGAEGELFFRWFRGGYRGE